MTKLRDGVEARRIGVGRGEQIGSRDDDGWAPLRCPSCSATWRGSPREWCGYCIRWLELANETQRRVVLRPDLPDTDDPERWDRFFAWWARRLAVAVRAEIITEHEARSAWAREVQRAVA